MMNRRFLLAGALAAPAFAQNVANARDLATPVATAASTGDILPDWRAAQAAMTALGMAVNDAVFAGDRDAILAVADDAVAAVLSSDAVLQDAVSQFTTDQLRFHFREVDAWFYGQFKPTSITGVMFQGSALSFSAEPESTQSESYPTGQWEGVIGEGVIDLGCLLEFTGSADALEISLSIPSQMLIAQPMSEVEYQADLPIGAQVDERSMPTGGDIVATNLWSAEYEWGGHSLVLQTVWDTDMRLIGLSLAPVPPLPDEGAPTPIACRLPFDGAWLIYWGGSTIFSNYHAATAPQRHALDISIWQVGATCRAPGTSPEDYWCIGQPLLAPVAGKVVHVEDGFEDILPQTAPSGKDHPAGNHIVLETEGGFIYLAHCQQDTIQVAEGDTVAAGDVVARVGNSGNTSEPHIHIHAQSVADFFDPTAVGVPLVFADVLIDGDPVSEASLLHGQIVEPN